MYAILINEDFYGNQARTLSLYFLMELQGTALEYSCAVVRE